MTLDFTTLVKKEENIPKMKPTSPLIKSKMLRTKFAKTALTDSRAERMVLKIERKISKMEATRFSREDRIDAMVG